MWLVKSKRSPPRRYNLPNSNEIAIVFRSQDGEPRFEKDIAIHPKFNYGRRMIVFDSWPLSRSNSRKSQRNSSERFYFNEAPRSHQDTVRYQCRFALSNLFVKWRIWFMITSDSEFTGTYNSFHASAFLDVFNTHVRSESYKFIFSGACSLRCNTIT